MAPHAGAGLKRLEMALYPTRKLSTENTEESWLIEPMLDVLLTLKAHTTWTWRHLGNVARYAVAFGRELKLSNDEMLSLQCAAVLHDVGKLSVSTDILDKSGPLNQDEWYSITKHPVASTKMLKAQTLPTGVVSTAQCHHERYDGTGYPLGLSGDAIPYTARILSLADACDAMLSERPYRSALKPDQVLTQIRKAAGQQFDPALVRKLQPLIEKGLENRKAKLQLRVISDNQSIFRQLWFAAQPNGWDLEAWPMAWEGFFPPELRPDGSDESYDPGESSDSSPEITLTVVDGRCVGRLSAETLQHIPENAIWIDPPHVTPRTLNSPLDIRDVLAFLREAEMELLDSSQSDKIQVVIADPYHLFRQVLRRCLDERDDVEVVAEVSTPEAYRHVISSEKFDVAIVASDMLTGSRTTSPLKSGDMRLVKEELITGHLHSQPTVVLVADEDIDNFDVALYDSPLTRAGGSDEITGNCIYVHRGAPAERLIEAMKSIIGNK